MLEKLRKLLAECHYTGGELLKTLMEANYDYCIARASEEMEYAKETVDPQEANRRLMLATRLITLARFKLANPDFNTRKKLPRKRRGRSVPVPPGEVDVQ